MRTLIALSTLALLFGGCKRDDDDAPPSGGGNGGGTAATGDVYLCGYEEASSSSYRAMYWLNGDPVEITDGSYSAVARAITATDEHVYVVGSQEGTNDLQMAAMLWVDGTPTELTDHAGPFTTGSDIVVKNDDIYISGTYHNGSGYVAAYWVNGVLTDLTDGDAPAKGTGIFVDGTDVYVSGDHDDMAMYWLNGSPVVLGDGVHQSTADDVWVHDGDVYVCGSEDDDSGDEQAVIWVNGVRTGLTVNGGWTTEIMVVNGTVYVAGAVGAPLGGDDFAAYWVNGVEQAPAYPTGSSFNESACQGLFVQGGTVHTISLVEGAGSTSGLYSNNSTGATEFFDATVYGVFVR